MQQMSFLDPPSCGDAPIRVLFQSHVNTPLSSHFLIENSITNTPSGAYSAMKNLIYKIGFTSVKNAKFSSILTVLDQVRC